MVSLLLLICVETGCFAQAERRVFTSDVYCEIAGEMLLSANQERAKMGALPPHNAMYKCIDWGVPS